MACEAQQRFEIARLSAQVEHLQQSLQNSSSELDVLRISAMPGTESEQLLASKADVDHERQKVKAIWAAIKVVAGEDMARRIEEEVSRRPIVAAPKVRRRGTMPEMGTPRMNVVAKTAASPKWPPAAASADQTRRNQQQEPAVPMPVPTPEVAPKVDAVSITGSIPPSVARQLFGGSKSKDQKETATAEPISLPMKLNGNVTSDSQSARVADVPSPMRRRETSTNLSSVPLMPRPHTTEFYHDHERQKTNTRSVTPKATLFPQQLSLETPLNKLHAQSSKEGSASLARSASVRDRIRHLELNTRRNSIKN